MISPRAPRDGDRSRGAALPAACGAIGVQLMAARETRQLSVEALASTLLLSKGQILGLERGDPAAFYNTDYYMRGLRKYMASMNVPLDLLDGPNAEEEDGLRLTMAEVAPSPGATPSRTSHTWTTAAAVLILSAAAAGGAYLVRSVRPAPVAGTPEDTVALATATPLPAQPILLSTIAARPVAAEPAMLDAGDEDSTLRISVGKPTWVFIRYPDNRVTEHRLAAGQQLTVGSLPVFLAVGTADSVEVHVEDRPVALEPYIRNGQVRITRPELAKLVP